jgi:metal-responsive CopG/Arc/MetJ family transcriptional regulator
MGGRSTWNEAPDGRTHPVIADDVVEAMDRLIGERGRSRFLETAAREKLARIEWRDRPSTTAWVRAVRRT